MLFVLIEFIVFYVSRTLHFAVRLSLLFQKDNVDVQYQVVAVSVYRLTFHLLVKCLGPLLSKLSDWSIVIQATSGNRHLNSWRGHEKEGESTGVHVTQHDLLT
jgi:hypothetical protein